MNNIIRQKLLLLIFPAFTFSFIQPGMGKPVAYLNYAYFITSSGEGYFETYIKIEGKSILFKKDSAGKFRGIVGVTVVFKHADSISAKFKYTVLSPPADDSADKPDFIDVQRYRLTNGQYHLQLYLNDKNDTINQIVSVDQDLKLYYPDTICISDAEFLSSYKKATHSGPTIKNGYDLMPYLSDYYPDNVNKFSFYTEIYHSKEFLCRNIKNCDTKIIIRYSLESADGLPMKEYVENSIQSADSVNALLGSFDISILPSGKYYLNIKVVYKNNSVLALRQFSFIRQNSRIVVARIKMTDPRLIFRDSLITCIQTLGPISEMNEVEMINDENYNNKTLDELQRFFYNFWIKRDSANPERAWDKYSARVDAVNKKYSTAQRKGYKTDRGRVFLQYGPPNQRVESKVNPTSYPYEIWEYYQLPDGEVDRKFVFYEPNIVTNEYFLLHSTARGEVQNPQWQLILNSRFGNPNNVDQTNNPDPFGENTLDQFNNPR